MSVRGDEWDDHKVLKSKVTNIWPYHTIRTSVTPMAVRGDEWDETIRC